MTNDHTLAMSQLDAMIRVAEAENQHHLAGQLRKLRESVDKIITEHSVITQMLKHLQKGTPHATQP